MASAATTSAVVCRHDLLYLAPNCYWVAHSCLYGDVDTAAHAEIRETIKRDYSLGASLAYQGNLWRCDNAASRQRSNARV
jgi:hypothetical protein